MLVDTDHLISVTDAASRGLSKLVTEAEAGQDYVIMKHNRPVCAVMSMSRVQRLQELESVEDDLRSLVIALTRVYTDKGERYDFDEVLMKFGLEDDDLVTPDDEV